MTNLRIQLSDTTTPDVTNHYAAKVSGANASAAQASALQASTATASAGQASAVQASAATASAGQASTLQASVATASAAQASAVASAAQANAAKELAIGESAAKVSAAQASAASASAAQASASTEAMGDNAAMGRYILPTNGLDQTLPVDYSARYIRIRPPTLAGDGFINLSQIIVTDDFGNNIVKGANVYATSAKPAAKPASVVVDGTTTMRTAVNSWNAVTSKRATEFIEVDLGSVQAITSVRLIGPSDCPPNNPKCADRMMNLRIEMSTTTTPEVSDYYAEKASKLQASAAAAAASSASAATASSLQASAAVASAAQAFDTQRLGIEGSAAKASAAQAQAAIVSAAVASERQAADAKHLSLKDSSAKASAATASAAQASAASIAMGDDPTNGRYILPTNDKDQTIATNNTGQYIRIRPSTTSDGYLQLSQIFVYDPTGTNIAPGCFIFATSSFEQFKDPKILIDETAKIRTAPNIWQSATNNKNTEYVEIDLGSPQEISGIRLLGRGTCPSTMPNCQDRMRNVRLEINMDTNQELIDAQEGEAAAAAAKIKTAEEAVVSAAKAVEQQALADAKMTAQESAAKASAARAATDQDSAAKKAVRDGYDALAASAAQASAAIASVAIYRRSIGDIPEAGKFILTSSKTDQSLLFKQSGGGQEGGSQLIQTALGNDVMGRYVLVRPSVNKGDGYIHFSQIVVYDVLGDNMAVGKPVFATSTMRNTKEPSILVDGKMKPRKPPYIWHSATPDRENEFVEIDLGSMQTITGLRFIGRADCPITIPKCQERMLELRVEINEEPSEEGKAFFDDMGDDMEVQASMAQASAAVASAAVASAAAASTAKAAELAEDLAAGSDPKNGSFILPKAGRDQTMLINYKGRYLRVMPPATESDGWIHFSQIMVFNMEKNVALGMPVYATSTLDGAAAPSIVVDGNTELRGIPDIWHSATTDRSEYIEIDLGKETHVTSVRIIGRNDCPIVAWCDDRMNKLRIQVRNDTDADATATYMQIKSLQASAANALPVPVKPVPAPEPAPDTSRPVTPVPKPADVDVDTDVIANPIKTPYTPTAPMIIPQAVPMPIYIPSFNPQQFNPQQFNPQQFNPQQFNPQQFNPQGNPQGNPQRRNPEDSESESRYRKPRRYEVPSIQTKEPRLPHQTYSIQKGPRGIPYHTPRPSPRPKPNPLEPVDSEPSNSDPSQGRYVTGQSGGGKSLQDMSVNVNEYVARYVRILPSLKGDGYMNISQIMVFSILNVNLAAGQPVYATSTMDGSSPPSIVVDGSTRVRGLPNIWHSASTDKNEFIEIDLGSSQGIHSIRILGRNDCPIQGLCDARMNGLRVQLNEETSEDAMAAYKGPLPLPLPLPAAPLPAAPLPAAPLPAAPTASMPTASMPSRTVNVAGSTNTSGSITINKSACLAPVDTPDPSLPNGFERLWDTKGRKYVYQFNGQIVAHPIPPSKRVNRSYVQRPSGLPTVTRQQEAQILNLKGGGVSPLPTDIQIISDPNTTPPWKKYFDTLIRKYYYVTDKDERWEHPYTPRKPVNGEMKYGDPALPQGWDKYLDNSTNTYFYYYPSTGETTWDHPSPPPFPHGLDVISNNHISDLYTMYRDPSLKEIFYFNTVTTETFWILPQGILGGESAPGILSSNPVEAFTCQRIDVVAPGSIKLSPDNPNYIMTSHTPISMPVITSGPTASAAIAATASAASASAATASAATASEATASRP
jgi:hypothetical protein